MAFQTGETRIRFAWESVPGVVLDGATWYDHRLLSESLGPSFPLLQPLSLTPGFQRVEGLPSKIEVGGELPVEMEPDGLGFYLAAFQKKSATPVILTAGQSFSHKLAPSESAVDHDKTYAVRIGRNDGLVQLSAGSLTAGWGVVAGVQSVVTGTVNVVSTRASYWDFATVVLETASPTRPTIRGVPKHSIWELADHDLFVNVTNASGGIKTKIGSAAAFGGTELTLVAATWTTLLDESDVAIGDPDNPVQIYVPNFTGWTITDEWEFKAEEAALEIPWTSSLPTIKALNEIHLTLKLGDAAALPTAELKLKEFTLNAAIEVERDFHMGGRYSPGLIEVGQRAYSGALNRRYIDTALRKRLESGEPFAVDFTITSREDIGTSSDPFQIRGVGLTGRFSGDAPGVPGPGVFDEPLNFDLYPTPADGTHPDELTLYLDNSRSDMTT